MVEWVICCEDFVVKSGVHAADDRACGRNLQLSSSSATSDQRLHLDSIIKNCKVGPTCSIHILKTPFFWLSQPPLPKWNCLLCLCQLPGKSALSRVVCTLLELVLCSPHLALRVQMQQLCVCPKLVLTAYLHPQGPVFDLMCVPNVMHAKKMQSK